MLNGEESEGDERPDELIDEIGAKREMHCLLV
jgi:hypothetical protein